VNVLVVSGIWPPDVGGPASHAPELAAWLAARGHRVEAVVTAEDAPAETGYPISFVSRSLPRGVRHLEVARRIALRARHADVVYSTGMFTRSFTGAAIARTPLVVKLTSDPAFERARRAGVVGGAVGDFQDGGGGLHASALRTVRDIGIRRAAHVVCPSAYMVDLAISWGASPDRVTLLPNPAPDAAHVEPGKLDDRPALLFAGRLTTAKDLGLAFESLSAVPEAYLSIVGDGPDRAHLEQLRDQLGLRDRVRFLGPLPRSEALGLMSAADVVILSSAWENFPHGVVEALAVGTPVVATRVGGVPEIVTDGENGLLVEPGDAQAFGAALRRILDDDALRGRLAGRAAASVARYSAAEIYGRLEQILEQAAR
jgi:glycosyltransferase involved in cell wall biosynthesis